MKAAERFLMYLSRYEVSTYGRDAGSVELRMLARWDATKLLACGSCSFGSALITWAKSEGSGFFISTR